MPFIATGSLSIEEPLSGWRGRFFNSENLPFGYDDVVRGASIHPHSHPNEEVWHVIEGELEVTTAGETRIAGPGAVAIEPPDTVHAVRALRDGRAIVVDHPLRRAVGGVSLDG